MLSQRQRPSDPAVDQIQQPKQTIASTNRKAVCPGKKTVPPVVPISKRRKAKNYVAARRKAGGKAATKRPWKSDPCLYKGFDCWPSVREELSTKTSDVGAEARKITGSGGLHADLSSLEAAAKFLGSLTIEEGPVDETKKKMASSASDKLDVAGLASYKQAQQTPTADESDTKLNSISNNVVKPPPPPTSPKPRVKLIPPTTNQQNSKKQVEKVLGTSTNNTSLPSTSKSKPKSSDLRQQTKKDEAKSTNEKLEAKKAAQRRRRQEELTQIKRELREAGEKLTTNFNSSASINTNKSSEQIELEDEAKNTVEQVTAAFSTISATTKTGDVSTETKSTTINSAQVPSPKINLNGETKAITSANKKPINPANSNSKPPASPSSLLARRELNRLANRKNSDDDDPPLNVLDPTSSKAFIPTGKLRNVPITTAQINQQKGRSQFLPSPVAAATKQIAGRAYQESGGVFRLPQEHVAEFLPKAFKEEQNSSEQHGVALPTLHFEATISSGGGAGGRRNTKNDESHENETEDNEEEEYSDENEDDEYGTPGADLHIPVLNFKTSSNRQKPKTQHLEEVFQHPPVGPPPPYVPPHQKQPTKSAASTNPATSALLASLQLPPSVSAKVDKIISSGGKCTVKRNPVSFCYLFHTFYLISLLYFPC